MKKKIIIIAFFIIGLNTFPQQYIVGNDNIFEDLKARSTIGFNFAPLAELAGGKLLADNFIFNQGSILDKLARAIFASEFPGTTPNESTLQALRDELLGSGIINTDFLFAMSFSYEFTVTPYMGVFADVGFSIMKMSCYIYEAEFKTIPWSLGIRIYPNAKAPFGFFTAIKLGGTDIKVQGNLLDALEIRQYKEHGVYLGMEMGWRILLFPKTSSDWPCKISLDISLFDIGYYFVPWSKNLFSYPSLSSIKKLEPLAGFRFVPLSRIGFSISF